MDQGGPGSPHEDDAPPPPWAPAGAPGPYGPPPGYPPPGYPAGYGQPAPPAGWTSSDDRTWATLAHLSFFVLSIIGPLVILLTKGKESAYVHAQAAEALNFHITMFIAVIVSFVLVFAIIGFLLLPVVLIGGVVLTIMAAVASNRGEAYRYPVNLRLVH
jgi:uncharacterized Tic20 family protein